jgi:hypothetical protein
MTSFQLPVCTTWQGGELARHNLDMGREMAATGCMARIWEEDNRMLCSDLLTRKDNLFIAYSSSPGHMQRTRSWAVNYGWKWMRASRLERFTRMADPFHSMLDLQLFSWGLIWDWKGSTYVEAQLRAVKLVAKSEWGATQQEWAEPHGLFTGIDDFITGSYLNRGPTWTPLRQPASQNQPGLAWWGWTVCRNSRLDLSGRHRSTGSGRPRAGGSFPLFGSGLCAFLWIY